MSRVGRQAARPSRISNAPEGQATKPSPIPAPLAGSPASASPSPDPLLPPPPPPPPITVAANHGDAVALHWLAEDLTGAERLT